MRPVRLELSGFTAFREKSVVDFTKLDLFAITGPTGAGKTSLLDAITYALYGRTARLNKAGKELVSQGATAMSVVFEFQVGARTYRAARAIRGSSATVRVEVLENGAWKASSGRVTDANAEIEKLIGLDFGGFTKTVILPQGKFDVFLRGEPKERREVLAELLDVKIYGRMAAAANSKAKDTGIRVEERQRAVDASATQEAKAATEHQLHELTARRDALESRGEVLRKALPQALALGELRRSVASAIEQRGAHARSVAGLRSAIASSLAAIESETRELAVLASRLEAVPYDADEHLRLSGLRPKAEQLERTRSELAAEQARLAKSGTQLTTAEKKLEEAEAAAEASAAALQQAAAASRELEEKLLTLRSGFGSPDKMRLLLTEIDRAVAEQAVVLREEQEIRQLESRSDALDSEVGSSAMQLEDAETKLRKHEHGFEQLATVHRGASLRLALKQGEPCPVCEQTVHDLPAPPDAAGLTEAQAKVKGAKLAVDRASRKLNELQSEAAQLPERISRAKQVVSDRRKRIADLESQLPAGGLDGAKPALLAAIEQDSAAQREAAESLERLDAARAIHARAEAAAQQARHTRELVEADIRRSAQRVAALDQEREVLANGLGADSDPAEIGRKIAALDTAMKERRGIEARIREHELRRKQAESDGEAKRSECAALEASILAIAAAIERQEAEAARLETLLGDLASEDIEALARKNQSELDTFRLAVQRTELAITNLADRIARNEALRAEVDALRADAALYHDLGVWLNAGNFQQYLLESAYRILTKEGSRHLSHLSGGRYEFVYQDDEFAVTDHANAGDIRSVRTLSGGESFLASLALALALAESITQLNGDRGAINLESLFLDEGFSTLDPDTLGKVADALEVLHGGHRMVGIITHVASLAEQMPTRIEIVKGAGGSRVVQDGDTALQRSASG